MSKRKQMQKRPNSLVLMTSAAAVARFDRSDPAFIAGQRWGDITTWVGLCTEALINTMMNIQTAYLAVQGLPVKSRDRQFKNLLDVFGRTQSLNDELWQEVGRLRDALEDLDYLRSQLESEGALTLDYDFELAMIGAANDFGKALRDFERQYSAAYLTDPAPEGTNVMRALDEVLAMHNPTDFQDKVRYMRAEAARTGRRAGPGPIVEYILEQTDRLAQLHNLKTRGQQLARLRQELAQRPDVQAWLQAPQADHIQGQSLEVQAYARLQGMTHQDLRDMQRNRRRGKN